MDVASLKESACACICEVYSPDHVLQDRWGTVLQFMEPIGACGRCPSCRALGITPHQEPAPSPIQQWAVAERDYDALNTFARAASGKNGVVVMTYRGEAETISLEVGQRLYTQGVRHFAGLSAPANEKQFDPTFVDELPLAPSNLTPVSSFSYFASGREVSQHWLARRARPRVASFGAHLVDVLMVHESTRIGGHLVGRDIPAVSVATALQLLTRS